MKRVFLLISGYWLLVTGYWFLISGFWFLVTGFWFLISAEAFAQQTYPQLDISGFKKWETKQVEVSPQNNYFAGLTQLGGFYPTFTGGPWQERLQLKILGQLSENLSVTYDLEQQPESPDRFDVKVKYYNNELTFGDFTANFSGNEFVSASKYLNGVMFTAKDSWYDILTVPSAKLKSQTQSLTSQKGNNTRGPYNLGHGGIVEGSEHIELNGVTLTRNVDYTIDYFEGKVTFNRILSSADEFKYSYEYTNIIDLFFPALSKRDFFGFQSRLTIDPEKFGKPSPKEEPVINSVRETFPTMGTVEPEVRENEEAGIYQLTNYPVLKFSESLTFMGTELKKNEDYLIRYEAGEIKLLTRFLPSTSEPLTVTYKYYQTSTEVEEIAGIGSRGPYHTSQKHLVAGSERVEVDGKLMVRDLDYTIKYHNGEILFGTVIGPTSQIKVSYRYEVWALPAEIPPKHPKEIKLGMTYLKESAKKGARATASAIESATGTQLTNNNFILKLTNRPLSVSTSEPLTVRIKRGDLSWELTKEVDYTIPTTEVDSAGNIRVIPDIKLPYTTDPTDPSDGYKLGAIYFYNDKLNLQATDEITVSYTYYKSIVGKYSGIGNGSRGPYYLRNVRNIVPGTETVQVWEQGSSAITTYTRNASFDASAGDTGYRINYDPNNPSITFNVELPTTKNFQVIYQYVPPSGTTGGDISQAAYGLDGSFKIGEIFKVDTSFARSETDQVYPTLITSETFPGNGSKTYPLHPPNNNNIVEDSEKIMVNNQTLNKDTDYYINYTSPFQFTFYYITPTSQDVISVNYSYIDGTSPIAETKTKTDTAFRLGAETKVFGDILTVNGTTKKIGFDFSPLGSTAIGVGSEYEEYNVNFKPPFHSFYTNYSYKFNKNPIGNTRQTFLRSFDNAASLGINPGGILKIDFSYRNYRTRDDLLPGATFYANDNDQDSFSGSVIPAEFKWGLFSLALKSDFRKTISKTDVVDAEKYGFKPPVSTIDFIHWGADSKLSDRISLSYDFQQNEPYSFSSQEVKTTHSRVIDHAYNLNLDFTMLFLQKWTGRISLLNHEEKTLIKSALTTDEVTKTKNETYHTDITPFSFLTASADHNRQERSSYVVGGENPRSERTTYTAQLTPISWLSLSGNYSRSETVPETGKDFATSARTKGGDINWSTLSLNFLKLDTRFNYSSTLQQAPTGTSGQKVTTITETKSGTSNVNFTLIPLLPINFSYTLEEYRNNNDIGTVSTETQNITYTANTSLSPPVLPQLVLSADFNKKVTKDLKSNLESPKITLSAKASYQVFNWGTLNYETIQERNEGEVQGGVLAGLNYFKNTQSYSLSINIPIDSPVLTSFVILASLKTVNYQDFNNSANNIDLAKLMTFEGTMNF
ncbi:MAG: hypothetical protein ACPL4K_00770 [Candidatus Margulisiibacteriota bacterium]